ncbi:hypothetical protein MVES1_002918 [Malassezia vespertilionis]|uniref:Uncharacterized protein n=1 Tax=Malassezia vespertilionis TaxID=2020962 RepID=A0A2N1J906_9BASI|nr:uncharacterized protein MVES1_002918 [Malassezia vespertilionis]PKI83043.1 hypothetical protein MVES_002767 [Malassezia vespertilionis]WFD07551.1 hypothetical protein MVES1_002918 [Malassezia vespertilionis]
MRVRKEKGTWRKKEADSFEACMDEGVGQEERGERFSTGEKAQRHYEQAFAFYARAIEYAPQSVDALYNAARVQYVLGTEFLSPSAADNALCTAVHLYVDALRCAPHVHDGIPDASRLDVMSNCASALQALGELYYEFGLGPTDLSPALRALSELTQQHLPSTAPTPTPFLLYTQALHLLHETAQGQTAVLSAQVPMGESGTSVPSMPSSPVPDTSGFADAFTSSLVAPSSLLETYSEELACVAALLGEAEDANAIAHFVHEAQRIQASVDAFIASLPPGFGASQSPEEEWDHQCMALTMAAIVVRVAAVQRASEVAAAGAVPWPSEAADALTLDAVEQEVSQRATALLAIAPPPQSLTAVRGARQREEETIVSYICDIGDHAHALAGIRIRQGAPSNAALVWEHCALAVKCLNTAAAAFEPLGKGPSSTTVSNAASASIPYAPLEWVPYEQSTSLVQGATNMSNTISRARASIYASLASAALTRTDAWLVAHWQPARESRDKLTANARIYARRALADQGMQWVFHVTSPREGQPMLYGRARGHLPPSGGWEALVRDAEFLLLCVRAVYLRGVYLAEQGGDSTSIQAELNALGGAVWSLLHLASPNPWQPALVPEDSLRRMLEAQDDPALSEQESEFWHRTWIPAMQSPYHYPGLAPPR